MPQDRLRSPRAGHGRRTASLNDFEYRVWDQYQLSADDFGVMRCSALTIQDDNDALADRPKDHVQAALGRLVEVGLCLAFEHQGRRYLCQADWQAFQKIEYPRVTMLPKPPPEVLQQCELSTRKLFGKHPGGSQKRTSKISRRSPEDLPKDLQRSSEGSPTSRARVTRETANGLRQEANGQRPTAKDPQTHAPASTPQQRFERFWDAYPRKKAKEAARKAWSRIGPDESLLAVMLAAISHQRRSPGWLKDGGQFIPHPATWLNQGRWQDEPDMARPVRDGPLAEAFSWTCPHEPQCGSAYHCDVKRRIDEGKRAATG